MSLYLTALLISFFIGMILMPPFIKLSKRLKASQTLLSYLEVQHSEKKGVATMGGSVFIVSTVAATLILGGHKGSMALVIMLITAGYGVVGFLDDFIKTALKRNLGLKAYQKIIFQLSIAIIAAFYCKNSRFIGTAIELPAFNTVFDMGNWYIPFAAVTFIAMSNSVNLTDGLDGLAGTTNVIYLTFFAVILVLGIEEAASSGDSLYQAELQNLTVFTFALIGGISAFLWFNSHKAKIIMGDTGALALGGAAAAIALFVKNPLISILIGIMFVISSVSVIIQVISFKTRKKRVFLMSPFHHHLELKGYNESKIVAFYAIVTAVAGVVGLIII